MNIRPTPDGPINPSMSRRGAPTRLQTLSASGWGGGGARARAADCDAAGGWGRAVQDGDARRGVGAARELAQLIAKPLAVGAS
eukprot:486278-Alexandrium_andersonii.AAC.1